jgi:hypothetical protein
VTVAAWTKHLHTEEERERYRSVLWRSRKIFEHILELIKQNEASLDLGETSPSVYDKPNWDYRQAHANGYRQCLRDFKKLFTLDQQEKDGRQPITRGQL